MIYSQIGKALHAMLPPLNFGEKARVRVVVIQNNDHVLLVRNWFGYQNWTLPGGGVKKTESAGRAAARELSEETGLQINPHLFHYLGFYPCYESKNPFTVHVYTAHIKDLPAKLTNSPETIEIAWHSINKLPKNLGMPIGEIVRKGRGQESHYPTLTRAQ